MVDIACNFKVCSISWQSSDQLKMFLAAMVVHSHVVVIQRQGLQTACITRVCHSGVPGKIWSSRSACLWRQENSLTVSERASQANLQGRNQTMVNLHVLVEFLAAFEDATIMGLLFSVISFWSPLTECLVGHLQDM